MVNEAHGTTAKVIDNLVGITDDITRSEISTNRIYHGYNFNIPHNFDGPRVPRAMASALLASIDVAAYEREFF